MSKSGSIKHKWIMADWDGEALWPHANYDLEQITSRLKKGTSVRLQFAQPRSLPRHRLYWVLLRQVVKNNEFFATEEDLHKTLLVGCGVTEPMLTVDGDIVLLPSSTAFDAMEEDRFKAYFDAMLLIIRTKILPGVDVEDLLTEARKEARWTEKMAA